MPIYEYRCSACDHLAELLHGVNDPAPQFCPSCGAEGTMRKAFAAPAILFKGSGWAKVDRRSTSGSTSSSKPKESKDDSSSTTSGSETSTASSSTTATSGSGSSSTASTGD